MLVDNMKLKCLVVINWPLHLNSYDIKRHCLHSECGPSILTQNSHNILFVNLFHFCHPYPLQEVRKLYMPHVQQSVCQP